jgi:hypothetical protein
MKSVVVKGEACLASGRKIFPAPSLNVVGRNLILTEIN